MDKLSAIALLEKFAPIEDIEAYQPDRRVRNALTALALATKHALIDPQIRVHAFALRDLEPALVARACLELSRTEEFFSTPKVIRAMAARITQADADAETAKRLLPAPRRDEPTYVCLRCQDGFWESLWCPGAGEHRATEKPERHHGLPTTQCLHPRPHAQHSHAVKCGCVETNPVIAEQRRRHRQFIESKRSESKGGRS